MYDMELEEYTMAMEAVDEIEAAMSMLGQTKNMTCMSLSLRSTSWR